MGICSLGFGVGHPDAQVHAEESPGFTAGPADVLDIDGVKGGELVLVS
jgi:hypothetical protein